VPNFIEIGETTLEKTVTIVYTNHYFGTPGVTGLGGGVHHPLLPLATCKISSRFDDNPPRYLLPNFVDLLAGVTHKKDTQKHTVSYTVSLCRRQQSK